MKKVMKKIIAAVLVISVLSQPGMISYADAGEAGAEKESNEVTILKNLGFVDETFGPKTGDEAVSRGQVASIIAYVRGFDKTAGNIGRKFIDIPTDYWCAGQIYALYEAGIINGMADDLFCPNDYVTYPQIIKCLVILLGYSAQAEQQGGYPNGYIKVASGIGLGGANTSGALDFDAVAKLIVKAMDTELMELNLSGAGNASYSKTQNLTPLKKYNDIYYDTGIMTDNGISALTGDTAVGESMVIIGGTALDRGECEVEDKLGYNLKYYYIDEDGDKTLLFAVPYRMNVAELSDSEIDIKDPQFTTRRIYYEASKLNNYYKVDDYADVIYNGKAYPAYDVDTFKITQGNLKLVDNDGDGDYDVVFVNEYYSIYVSGVDTDNETVFGKYGDSVNYGSCENAKFYTTDGSLSSAASINIKQVLSVFESKDRALMKIVISSDGVSGKIDSLRHAVTKEDIQKFPDIARDMRITIGDEEFSFTNEYINAIAAGYQGAIVPAMGLAYAFHLDCNRKIAGIEDPTGIQYAYLIRAYLEDDGSSEMYGMTAARLFMQDGTLLTTVFAKTVKIDGLKLKGQTEDDDGVYKYSGFYDDEGTFLPQPVKIRMNNLGEVTELETASSLGSNTFGYDKNKFTKVYSNSSAAYGGHTMRSFNNSYTLANDVVIFNIPPLSEFDERECGLISETSMAEGSKYPITLYDADASWACKFATIQAGESSDWNQACCVIESVQEMLVGDEAAKVAMGIETGKQVTFVENKPGVFPAELAPGDIVRVVKGVGNKILRMQILASATRNTEPFFNSLDGTDWSSYYGQLYARSDTGFTLTMDGGKTIEAMPFNDTPVTVYDMKTKKARRGSRNDMVMSCPIMDDGKIDLTNCDSMIYVYKRRGYARNIVVVKK